jgi:hypothetical protein
MLGTINAGAMPGPRTKSSAAKLVQFFPQSSGLALPNHRTNNPVPRDTLMLIGN